MASLPNTAYPNGLNESFFDAAKECLETMITELKSDALIAKEHGDIEGYINQQGHEVMRCLLQGHLDNVATTETGNRDQEGLFLFFILTPFYPPLL
ncbi:hypothetical protein N9J26_00610 [bacterium]|nr:hypothetical protein [bacterium]